MTINKKEIKKIAHLARINVSQAEVDQVEKKTCWDLSFD